MSESGEECHCCLTLHDLRHEATSRLFEKGFDVMEVRTITGHQTLQTLARCTHLRTEDSWGGRPVQLLSGLQREMVYPSGLSGPSRSNFCVWQPSTPWRISEEPFITGSTSPTRTGWWNATGSALRPKCGETFNQEKLWPDRIIPVFRKPGAAQQGLFH